MNPIVRFFRGVRGVIGTMVTLVMSLLPLSALLVALPAVAPNEAVLADSVPPANTRFRRLLRCLGGVGAGFVVVVALFASAVELVSRLPLPAKGQFGVLAQKALGGIPADYAPAGPPPTTGVTAGIAAPTPPEMFEKKAKLERALAAGFDDPVRRREAQTDLDTVNAQIAEVLPHSPQLRVLLDPEWGPWLGQPLWKLLPPQLVQHWPFVFLVVYATDLALLLMIGRVPLAYNVRNLVVRWRIAGLTALAFTVVVALLVALLAFVNGMYKLNEGTGIPGNVFVLSDGATDELFSNLGYGDVDNALRQTVTIDEDGYPVANPLELPDPLQVEQVILDRDKKAVTLSARPYAGFHFTSADSLAVTVDQGEGNYSGEMKSGDIITAIDGHRVSSVFEYVQRLGRDRRRDTPIKLTIKPGDRELDVVVKQQAKIVRPETERGVYLASKEIYFVVSQPVPVKEGEQARRRLLNMRAIDDAPVAAAVHNITLYDGGRWFTQTGMRQIATGEKNADGSPRVRNYVECVLGEGAAGILGADANKPRLEVGDTFELGDLDWIVVGIMRAEGTTFGSEVWVQNIDVVTKTFGKKGQYTTMVVRTDRDTIEAARALAHHLQNRYTTAKFKAFPEPEYYAELTKTNDQFLTSIVFVAAIMAVGGVFGVMNTMFAAIAARIREVGVLRILGFKRWQILISFMLESLIIAAAGGALGCLIGYAADGVEARSQMASSGGGGKSVSLKMVVDYQTVAAGMLFTLVMGRLGGLVPALSAMRMEILDSLR